MKKVLIITYYWPPAGGPGVQRWLKFVKYLPEFGIFPIVYIPENPEYPIIDENLVREIPENLVTIRKKIWEPYRLISMFSKNKIKRISSGIIPSERKQSFLEKIALWSRGNLFIPDARVFWVGPSAKFLKKYIIENGIETIVTTGPPHSLHLIGRKLKSSCDVKWIADFRDPWTTIGYQKSLKLSNFSEEKHRELEAAVLNEADQIIVTSKTTKEEFEAITYKPIEIISNGYDIVRSKDITLDKKFSISHIGSLLSERNPGVLWHVLSELTKDLPGFADNLEIKLIGTVSNEVIESVNYHNLKNYTTVSGYVSHPEAILQQQRSQVLLLVEINSSDTRSIVPGKLFEYMVAGRPIIGIGPIGSDFADIIAETNTGIFVNYSEKDKLKDAVIGFYQLYLAGKLRSEPVGIDKYSRKNLTGELARLLLN